MSTRPAKPDPAASTLLGDNAAPLSVSQLSRAVKSTLEGRFSFVRVRGEVSRPKYAASGHLYFTLKDETSVLETVAWRPVASQLLRVAEGMDLIITGKLTTYGAQSRYQLQVESLELAGEGALLAALEQLKQRLKAEGLFDADKKRPIPFLPQRIGVITSPTGAVIRDILHRLAERFARPVLLWPVAVQGKGAAAQIAAAISGFNALSGSLRPDLLIVARGGGSLEDLWPYNEEAVVRATAASIIPLISAVGHETDTMLIDFAADRRAPTPSAAAEMAVPVRAELQVRVAEVTTGLKAALWRKFEQKREAVRVQARLLPQPLGSLADRMQRLDERYERLEPALAGRLQRLSSLLTAQSAALPTPRQRIELARRELLEQQRVWQRSGQRSGQGIAAQRRQGLGELAMRLERALAERLQQASSLLATRSAALPVPRQEIELARRELREQSRAWQRSGQSMEQQRRQRLNELVTGLAAHEAAHHALKAQGYVTVHSASGMLIAKAKDIKTGQPYLLRYAEGEARVLGAPATPPALSPKSRSALPAKRSGKTAANNISQQPKLI